LSLESGIEPNIYYYSGNWGQDIFDESIINTKISLKQFQLFPK